MTSYSLVLVGDLHSTVGITDSVSLPAFTLGQNFPNPFFPSTVINFKVIYPGNIIFKIYDSNGREIRTSAGFRNFRTPYLSQSKLADILKTILNSVPGNVVSVWFNRFASSSAA